MKERAVKITTQNIDSTIQVVHHEQVTADVMSSRMTLTLTSMTFNNSPHTIQNKSSPTAAVCRTNVESNVNNVQIAI